MVQISNTKQETIGNKGRLSFFFEDRRPKRNRVLVCVINGRLNLSHILCLKSYFKNMFFFETVLDIKPVKIRDGLYYGQTQSGRVS